jgi:hypothetical protein
MDLYDFYRDMVADVAHNGDLSSWAHIRYGSPVSVYTGFPTDGPPDMTADTPFLMFAEPSRQCSQNRREIIYSCGAWLGLSVTGDQVRVEANLTEPAGVEQILDGMRLVRLAVVEALPEGVTLEDFEEYADVNAVGSEVHGQMAFVFKQTLTIGQDPML